MQTRQITRANIGSRTLAMSVRGVTDLLKDKQVLHCEHVGAAFVISHVDADFDPVAQGLAATKPTFVITLDDATLRTLGGRRGGEMRLPVFDVTGASVADIRVHNKTANPITQAGRMNLKLALASSLKPGDRFCDGSTDGHSDAWVTFTADADSTSQYLPGRLVYKVPAWPTPRSGW